MAQSSSNASAEHARAHPADCGEPVPCCPFCGFVVREIDAAVCTVCHTAMEPEYWCSGCGERVTQDGAAMLVGAT
jgi:hypothetical protein